MKIKNKINNVFYKQLELIYPINDFDNEIRTNIDKNIFTANEIDESNYGFRKRHLFGKYLTKKIISNFLKIDCYDKIEVVNDMRGKPVVIMSSFLKDRCNTEGINNIFISISHSKNFITAMAVFSKF